METRYIKIIELLELQEFLSVIERDKKGMPIKVSGAYEASPYRKRLAKNKDDFKEIYEREIIKYNISTENINTYIKEFEEIISEMIFTYKNTHSYKLDSHNKRDLDLLNTANSFISFLDCKLNQNKTLTQKIDIKYINSKLEEPFSDFFINSESFLIFNKFMKYHLVNPYKDISFLFQQLKSEKRLLGVKHLEFAKLLLEKKYINEKTYEDISDKKGFDNKSKSADRLNNYYNIINEIDKIEP